MKRWLAICAVFAMGFSLAHGIDVDTEYDRTADFSGYRSFAWKMEPLDFSTDSERLRLDKLIRESIENELTSKGLEHTDGKPDFRVVYTAFAEAASYGAIHRGTSAGAYAGWELRKVEIYAEGNLVVEFFDGETDDLVWRGWARGGMKPEKRRQRVPKVVKRMLKNFPPSK